MTRLYYDNKQILSGQPTPLVSREDSMVFYGERWADQTTITLNGQITGCVKDFSGLVLAQKQLIDIFSRDFQTFRIEDDYFEPGGSGVALGGGGGSLLLSDGSYLLLTNTSGVSGSKNVYEKKFCVIKGGVKFPSSNYVGILEYNVSFDCYEENLFSGYYGVLDPENSWEFEETEDGKLQIIHTVSARGFNTNPNVSNAYMNAKNFVATHSGLGGMVTPYFNTLPSGVVPCLRKEERTADRFNGRYSLKSTYEADYYYNNGGVLRYTASYNCDSLAGIAKVSIDGEVNGCRDGTMDDLRTRYGAFNVFAEAQRAFTDAGAPGTLNSGYLSSGVTEDQFKKQLNFNISFDNFIGANTYFDYKVTLNSGENDITTVSLDGTIGSRGDLRTRWDRVTSYYENDLDVFGLASGAYYDYAGAGADPLNREPSSSGVTFNKYAAEIRTTATWDNKVIPLDGFITFDYTMNFLPSLERVVAKPLVTNENGPICANGYYVVDLGYKNRCNFTLDGNGRIDCETPIETAIANLKTFANSAFSTYCPQGRPLLETDVITTGTNKSLSFAFSWSAESPNNVIDSPNDYESVDNLSIN